MGMVNLKLENPIVLLHGFIERSVFDVLMERNVPSRTYGSEVFRNFGNRLAMTRYNVLHEQSTHLHNFEEFETRKIWKLIDVTMALVVERSVNF